MKIFPLILPALLCQAVLAQDSLTSHGNFLGGTGPTPKQEAPPPASKYRPLGSDTPEDRALKVRGIYGDHLYRKVGDRYYNLAPLYDWLASERRDSSQPMPDWIVATGGYSQAWKISRMLPEGILVDHETRTVSTLGQPPAYNHQDLFLKNYPGREKLRDGERLDFIALKIGTYRFGDFTIEAYDYGVPYNPFQLAADRSWTNSISTNSLSATH